jgi:predicted dehydrogenase
VYADWAEMLAREKLDAVFILLPPHLHGELEAACATRVPAVLVEKPLARDLATSERALEAFAAAGTFAAAAYMNRCRRSVLRARELFAAPGEGPILIEGRWVTPVPPPAWWRDKGLSGGQFVEQCTHFVDIARFVAGKIVEVSAISTRGFIDDIEGYATDDAMIVSARFASGALAQFSTGCFPRGGLDEDAGIGMTIASRRTRCTLSGWGMALRAETVGGEVETLGPEEDIFEVEDRLFLKAAASGDRRLFPSTYADGLETLRVTLAADESAAAGRAVRLA